MHRLSDNYYHRKCYLEREQVPTQTVMKNTMHESLVNVYFKSMRPRLKILAGLEPPMKGGGTEWYMPPKEILAGRHVLTPVKKAHLKLLGFDGINTFGEKVKQDRTQEMMEEKRRALHESDIKWKQAVLRSNKQHYDVRSEEEAHKNSEKILSAVNEFELMYRTSVTKVEEIVMNAAIKEINRIRQEAFEQMEERYAKLLKCQAANLYDMYEEKLNNEKETLKRNFIKDVDQIRTKMGNNVHDINYDKHLTIEKLRHYLECQNLACQMYVALKEKEELQKELELIKHDHHKKITGMKKDIAIKDFEIQLEKNKMLERQEFNRIWKQKICHIVKKFQMFVEYCLKLLPEQAEFFLNMEKLMMLQLNEAIENPSAVSIFVSESGSETPVARPHPFYLFCDKGYKPKVDAKLCPNHCTSSASQMPVVIINKRCIYSACDNLGVFSDKVTQYICGHRGDEIDIEDDHNYELDVPVKCTSLQRLKELKLESSLMQVLQQELPNARELPIECCVCKIPYCFCSPLHPSKISMPDYRMSKTEKPKKVPTVGNQINTRNAELHFYREPKWESYFDFVEPKKCKCAKTAKKHLLEHMPAYMRQMSAYEPPELPNYEPVELSALKKMVKKARGIQAPPPLPEKEESKTKDIGIQYSDNEFEYLCTCLSDEEIGKLFANLVKGSKLFDVRATATQCDIVDGDVTPSYMAKMASSFATNRAYSLRNLLDDAPSLEEIFRKHSCDYVKK